MISATLVYKQGLETDNGHSVVRIIVIITTMTTTIIITNVTWVNVVRDRS